MLLGSGAGTSRQEDYCGWEEVREVLDDKSETDSTDTERVRWLDTCLYSGGHYVHLGLFCTMWVSS